MKENEVKSNIVTSKPRNPPVARRKPGFSIVNPNAKRHIAKGVKIGDE